MTAQSAGILLHRVTPAGREVWIAHMGGPFWAHKDDHAWSIPKGEYRDDEAPMDAARREFEEETGLPAPDLEYVELGTYRYSSGKLLTAFAAEALDFDPPEITPGTFDLEWPPKSGRFVQFPEIDKAAWMTIGEARPRLVKAQHPILDDLPE